MRLLSWFLVLVLGGAAVVLGVALWVIAATSGGVYYRAGDVPKEDVALVLGASIKSNGQLSTVLQERADAAAALYEMGKGRKILVSGDNATLEYNEVYPVGKYLLSRGVPEADIFLDYAGFDTYSSMYRAKNIFGVSSMVIASQRFHLPRALYLARAMGIDAAGLDASAPGDSYFFNALREIPATLKAVWDVATRRVPQYLGPQFFVSGDGSATWVGPKAEMLYFTGGK